MISLIINAGGNSQRIKKNFSDLISKCWLIVDGKPIIIRNILNLQKFVQEIIIVVNNSVTKQNFQSKLDLYKKNLNFILEIKIIVDDDQSFPYDKGPLLGIKTGIKQSTYENLIFVPSDIPFLDIRLINQLLDHIEKNTIVTLKTKEYFNTLIFGARKPELMTLLPFQWKRVTDIYRLFPNVTFLEITPPHDVLIMGINTVEDYESANALVSRVNTVMNNKSSFNKLYLKRETDLLDKSVFGYSDLNLESLINQKCFYLAISLIKLYKIKLYIARKDLLLLESKLWKEINELIYNHCLRDIQLDSTQM